MSKTVANKIRNLRLSLGLNQSEMAERFNVTQASVSRWEKGSMPDADKLAQLAEMAGESIRSFIDNTGSAVPSSELLNRFWVKGTVVAGVWSTAYEWPQEEWVAYSGGTHIGAQPDKRFGLRCEGDSMNQVYPPGTVVDCISIEEAGVIRSGQRVVVEREREGGEIEATVKEYIVTEDGREWLVPRSNNPAFQAPISATEPGEGIVSVRVVAVVVGSYRPE